jgi:hypothetical protein
MIVIDNWYENPDDIRNLALSKFKDSGKVISGKSIKKDNGFEMYPGNRVFSDLSNLIENKKIIEEKSGLKIDPKKWIFTASCNWQEQINLLEFDIENLSMKIIGTDLYLNNFLTLANGNFQYCPKDSTRWIHTDKKNTHAAVVYLHPNPVIGSGTGFFKHKETEKYYEDGEIFSFEESSDFDKWNMIEYVENQYNRCIIFDAKRCHSATKYFGDTPENSRLTQVFFFDIL